MEYLSTSVTASLVPRRRYINHIISAHDERPNLLGCPIGYFFCLVKHKVHVYIIALQDSPELSVPFQRYDYRFPVQDLI